MEMGCHIVPKCLFSFVLISSKKSSREQSDDRLCGRGFRYGVVPVAVAEVPSEVTVML
jgi:hypothetical protein